jgi:hypothetical protein
LNRILHYSQPGSQAKVDPKIASIVTMLGVSSTEQRNYLMEYLYLHPETKATIKKNKLNREKSMALTENSNTNVSGD